MLDRRALIAILAVMFLASSALIVTLLYRSRPSNVVLLTTASLKAALLPWKQGDVRTGGLALMAGAIHELRAKYGASNVLLLDAGNALYQEGSHSKFAEHMPEILKILQYNAITLGYRDFEILNRIDTPFHIPVVAANLASWPEQINVVRSKQFIVNGIRIAVIGIVDPRAPAEQDPFDLSTTQVMDETASLDAVRQEVKKVSGEADFIVVLSSALESDINTLLAKELPQVDVIVTIGKRTSGVLSAEDHTKIVSPAWEGGSIGIVKIQKHKAVKRGTMISWEEVLVTSSEFRVDADMRDRIRQYWINKLTSSKDDHVIGMADTQGVRYELENDLVLEHPYWSFFNRPIYNLVVDAIYEAYPKWKNRQSKAPNLSCPNHNHPNIVLYNSGAIERGLPGGIITLGALKGILPYDNKIVAVTMTDEDVIAILNSPAVKRHGILLTSGLRYGWDYYTGVDPKSVTIVRDKRTEPLSHQHYCVLLTDFIATGGDGYLAGIRFNELREEIKQELAKNATMYPSTVDLVEDFMRRHSPVRSYDDRRIVFRR